MKVILDTNIWISGLLWGGIPGHVLKLARAERIQVYTSPWQLEELTRTLTKPKLRPKLEQLKEDPNLIIKSVRAISKEITASPIAVENLRDPDDAFILAIALAASADCIITGDDDLLILTEFSGIPILNPQTFLTQHFPNPR